MRNDDLKKITEIKQYLLDPPVSFKLNDLALGYVQDAINVLNNYADAKETTSDLELLSTQLSNKEIPQDELRDVLKNTGIKISNLTNK